MLKTEFPSRQNWKLRIEAFCGFCVNDSEKIFQITKHWNEDSPEKSILQKNRIEKDLNFIIPCNLPVKVNQVFKSQSARKTFFLKLGGCFHSLFKSWNIHKIFGKMTIESYGSVTAIDLTYFSRRPIFLKESICVDALSVTIRDRCILLKTT